MVFPINIKKYTLAVMVCSASFYASTAMAGGTLLFTGSVSANTCDVKAYASSGAAIQTLDLGAVEPKATMNTSSEVSFTLRPVCSTGSAATIASQLATITWTGELGDQGIINKGSAEGVVVVVRPTSAGVNSNPISPDSRVRDNQPISDGNNVITYKGDASKPLKGDFAYKASMLAPASSQSGTVEAQVTYSVTYL